MSVRVLIADDDPTLREALAELVSGDTSLELVGAAADAEEAVRLAHEHHPDVALLDVKMPRGGGPRAAREIKTGSAATRILALSAYGDRVAVVEMLRAGAVGYLLKGASATEILQGIHSAAEGGAPVTDELASSLIEELANKLEEEEREAQERKRRIERIRKVLAGDGLTMVFQPIFELESALVVGVEALARFTIEPARTPDVWFAEAEILGMGRELELAAVPAALGNLNLIPAEWFLSLNVSPATALAPEFLGEVKGISSERVVVEMTEHAKVDDYDHLGRALGDLRSLGVRIAIDDAGAGYASLSHILRLSPDFVKLDVTLTQGIETDGNRRALARALITFASEIGLDIIAEGIETQDALDALRQLGVRFGQGYHLARPGALSELAANNQAEAQPISDKLRLFTRNGKS